MPKRILVLAAVWVAQALPFIALLPLVLNGATVHDYVGAFTDRDFWMVVAYGAGGVTLAQALFLWQVRKPARHGRGRSLWLSVGVGALACAALTMGVVLALSSVPGLLGISVLPERVTGDAVGWGFVGAAGIAWLVWTPIVAAFLRRERRETALARLAARLLLGTVVEAVAIIPLDVIVRRKDNCYCGEGTFLAVLACVGIGWFALGPAVIVLPLLCRRRKRWYAGHCDVCEYDMSGCMTAERCPECGAGWRAAADEPSA